MKKSISVATGTYERNGEKKNSYMKIGVVIDKEDGKQSIKFEPIITNYLKLLFGGQFSGRANIFEETEKAVKKENPIEADEDLPFI